MNEFNTKLIELLELMYIYELTPMGYSSRDTTSIDILEKLRELKELNEQEIEQDNSTPLEDLDFSVRTCNCLKRYGVNTLNQLKDMSFNELNKVRNLGDKGKREILTFFMQEVFNK